MINFKTIIYIAGNVNFKTIYFNLRYFPFSVAIKFPVFVSSNFYLKECKGTIEIKAVLIPGMIKLGYGNVGIFDKHKSRGIWEVRGKVIFYGSVLVGHGNKLSVDDKGILTFGNNVKLTAQSSIICFNKIKFGNDCLVSWEVMMMDTDFHKIYCETGHVINADKEIIIGNHVWLGARSVILKGSVIPDNSVIAANSLVAAKLLKANCIYGGQPARILKEQITWEG